MRLNEVKGTDDVICPKVLLAAILEKRRGGDNSIPVILLTALFFWSVYNRAELCVLNMVVTSTYAERSGLVFR